MYFTTVVKVLADEPDARPLAGLHVRLYDHDRFSADDLLGEQVTDANGEARFSYTSDDFADLDDKLGGSMPDLYAVVSDASGNQLASTKSDVVENSPEKYLTVRVPSAGIAATGA